MAEVPLAERYLVLPSDGSQIAAIGRARGGESLVIQGPPGTGKSQTITNLIADYVARGKRVLFVCQKRAAIDVVHARLRQRGLDDLASLIHDSQADKRAFVMRLKQTYESWLAEDADPGRAEARRRAVLDRLAAAVAEIEAYETGLAEPVEQGGPSLREVIERLVDLRAQRWGDELPPELRRVVPSAAAWWVARPVVEQVVRRARRCRCGPPAVRQPGPVPGPRRAGRGPARGRGRRRGATAGGRAPVDHRDARRHPHRGRRRGDGRCRGPAPCDRRGDRRAGDAPPADRTSRALGGPPAFLAGRRGASGRRAAGRGARGRPREGARGRRRLAHAPRPRRRARGAGDRDGQGSDRSSGSSTGAGAGSRQRSGCRTRAAYAPCR